MGSHGVPLASQAQIPFSHRPEQQLRLSVHISPPLRHRHMSELTKLPQKRLQQSLPVLHDSPKKRQQFFVPGSSGNPGPLQSPVPLLKSQHSSSRVQSVGVGWQAVQSLLAQMSVPEQSASAQHSRQIPSWLQSWGALAGQTQEPAASHVVPLVQQLPWQQTSGSAQPWPGALSGLSALAHEPPTHVGIRHVSLVEQDPHVSPPVPQAVMDWSAWGRHAPSWVQHPLPQLAGVQAQTPPHSSSAPSPFPAQLGTHAPQTLLSHG